MKEIIKENEPFIGEMSAIVTTPDGFDPEKESLPVIVFLHGAGERGSIDRAHSTGLGALYAKDQNYRGLRVITISPWCPEDYIWVNLHYQLFDFIKKAVKRYNGDESRVSITGFSMGGYGTWDMAISHSDYFSAAAPICGGGAVWMGGAVKIPVRAFHGSADETVPLEESVKMVEKVAKCGGDVELTVYPGVGHNSWDRAYGESDLIEWLISKHK